MQGSWNARVRRSSWAPIGRLLAAALPRPAAELPQGCRTALRPGSAEGEVHIWLASAAPPAAAAAGTAPQAATTEAPTSREQQPRRSQVLELAMAVHCAMHWHCTLLSRNKKEALPTERAVGPPACRAPFDVLELRTVCFESIF